jgi:Ca2+/Na+ antiporter
MILNFLEHYWNDVLDGIEFIIAFGSIIGVLGIVVGLIGLLFSSQFQRKRFYSLLFFSIVLVAVCGLYRGLKYFRIFA